MFDTLFRLNNQLVTVDMLVDGMSLQASSVDREFAIHVPHEIELDSFEDPWYNSLREAA